MAEPVSPPTVAQLWTRTPPGSNPPDVAMALMERLATHRMLSTVPLAERAWIVDHGQLRMVPQGSVLASKETEMVPGLVVLLSGQVGVYVDHGDGPERVMGWHAGDMTGYLPYSRMTRPPGPTMVEEDIEFIFVHRDYLPELTRACHETTTQLVHIMLDRARTFKSKSSDYERMATVGSVFAGLAHELNNPASAVVRGTKGLEALLAALDASARAVGASGFSHEHTELLTSLCEEISAPSNQVRSPIAAARHEEEILDWLEQHDADTSVGEALAEASASVESLDRLVDVIEPEKLDIALRWIADAAAARRLTREINQAATQMKRVIDSVRGLINRTSSGRSAAEALDIGEGLTEALDMLRSKAQRKSVSISLHIEPHLPQVHASGSELNQIWTNLIDNAIDAVPEAGRVEVTATRDHGTVIVKVIDNGHGIADKDRERIFDPLFTTKTDSGTGLGLDIVRRLVRNHDGTITVESIPGRTEFCVALPIIVLRPQSAATPVAP